MLRLLQTQLLGCVRTWSHNPTSFHSDLIAMLVRIVRMTFNPEAVDAFLELFDRSAPKIRAFDGCLHLELLADSRYPNVISTYSRWTSESALNLYRESDLFTETWEQTKSLFAAPAVAYSHGLIRD